MSKRLTGAPKHRPIKRKSNAKRDACSIKLVEYISRQVIRLSVREGGAGRPHDKLSADRPDLDKPGINRFGDTLGVQNLSKRAAKDLNKKSTSHKGGDLRVGPRGTVRVDGPTLWSFMFGDPKRVMTPMRAPIATPVITYPNSQG